MMGMTTDTGYFHISYRLPRRCSFLAVTHCFIDAFCNENIQSFKSNRWKEENVVDSYSVS